MTPKSTVFALLSASLFIVLSAATATLAIDRDRRPLVSAADPASCPPQACSIVVKTDAGGAPSRILAPALSPRTGGDAGLSMVADTRM